jgi:hypothetical protein
MSLLRCRLVSIGTLLSSACGGESAEVHDITPEMCMQAGAQLADAECPSGSQPLPVRLPDARPCCADGPLTNDECLALGGILRADPGNGSLKECPEGKLILGGLAETIEGGFCCAP